MTENEIRYIYRMTMAFKENCMFMDATDLDCELEGRMRKAYDEGGGWAAGAESAFLLLFEEVQTNGVPAGEFVNPYHENIDFHYKQKRVPKIERPA